MSAETMSEDQLELYRDTVLELPKIDNDWELDIIVNHARLYGRCLFTVAGGRVLMLELHEDDMVGLHT